jgi:hypothetical protein
LEGSGCENEIHAIRVDWDRWVLGRGGSLIERIIDVGLGESP